MNCLKCGKEVGDKNVFCDACLAEMEKYPVKPGSKFFLPRRSTPVAVKKAPQRKKVISAEERISRMKKAIQLLSIVLAVTLLALVLSVVLLIDSVSSEIQENAIGQNYGTIDQED